MSDNKILVIGETCVDEFVYCSVERLSPEAPVPVLDIVNKTQNLGMAGNVAQNVNALGYKVELISNADFQTFTKTRYVDKKTNHMFCRIDSQKTVKRAQNLDNIDYSSFSAIIISDYNKGFLLPEDIDFIAKSHPITFLDSKSRIGDWVKNIKFIKINENEYLQSKDYIDNNILNKTIITLGSEGALLNGVLFPTTKVDVMDLSGAGDSFLAGLTVKYLQNQSTEESIKFGNLCAANVVAQRGVATIKLT